MPHLSDTILNEVFEIIFLYVGNKFGCAQAFLFFTLFFSTVLYYMENPASSPLFALFDLSPLTMIYQVKAWGQCSVCYFSKQWAHFTCHHGGTDPADPFQFQEKEKKTLPSSLSCLSPFSWKLLFKFFFFNLHLLRYGLIAHVGSFWFALRRPDGAADTLNGILALNGVPASGPHVASI